MIVGRRTDISNLGRLFAHPDRLEEEQIIDMILAGNDTISNLVEVCLAIRNCCLVLKNGDIENRRSQRLQKRAFIPF